MNKKPEKLKNGIFFNTNKTNETKKCNEKIQNMIQ